MYDEIAGQNVQYTPQNKGKKTLFTRKAQINFWGYTFITPALIIFIVFTVIPIILGLSLSFTNIGPVYSTKYEFVGLRNFRFIFRTDTAFWDGVKTIVFFALLTVPLTLTGSMLLALIIKKPIFGTKFFRGLFYLPGITSGVATAMVWSGLLNKDGTINALINTVNRILIPIFGSGIPNILLDTPGGHAIWGIIIMTLWGGLGGNMVLFLAGMNAIPDSIYEAAEVDGASRIRRFFSITLPLMKPTIFFALTLSIIGTLQMFEPLILLNVDGKTTTPVHQIYLRQRADQMGLATSQALLLFILIMIITLVMQKTNKERFF